MSRLQAIENEIIAINETVFQELGDKFLAIRNRNYATISRTGSQSGKQKTTVGTPDSFLLLPDGKYIFVEHSTNITKGVKKLEEDIQKCIDVSKTSITSIPLNLISEIILCINFNLKTDEIQKLRDLLPSHLIRLTIYTLDTLAIELELNHRDLVHEYLGLKLDTGQVVRQERFIKEYNKASKGIATPLDNTFMHRDQELSQLKNVIQKSDFIILTGAPGVGKTKLALEGITSFLSENNTFETYCISYKNHTLLDDLFQYFDEEKDYILFVDDANRIDAFSQITGFYRAVRKGKLKIIITVRDYAFEKIGLLCHEFSPKRINIQKLTDDQIIDIVKAKPFEILNGDYLKEIARIADGNPRLAIMTTLLAKENQNIDALSDVSDLFENYFSTFIKDESEFAQELNIKCLGLIAFFHTIPFKDRTVTTSILENFGIDYSSFFETIDKLDKLELVEIRFDHVKIPEQNLSNYFFYKVFIKDQLLPFEILLKSYFSTQKDRFKDSVIPANNTFGPEKVMNKLKPFLQQYLSTIETEDEAFDFLDIFWYYLLDETLAFLYEKIVNATPSGVNEYEVTYENNAFVHKNNRVLNFLGRYFRYNLHLRDALEMAFMFAKKKLELLPELIHRIKENLTFNKDDWRHYFVRQKLLFEILIRGLAKGELLHTTSFYELSKTFLSFKFEHFKSGRKLTFSSYHYAVPNSPEIQIFRRNIWETLDSNFKNQSEKSLDLLQKYGRNNFHGISDELIKYDLPFLLQIIENHLSNNSIDHCIYVQEQINWLRRYDIVHPSFSDLKNNFTNKTYKIYRKLNWNRLIDKEMYDFKDSKEYKKLKEEEVRTFFRLKNIEEVREFYDTYKSLRKFIKNDSGYANVLDLILEENCGHDFDRGCELLIQIINDNNSVNYAPWLVFKKHLNTPKKEQKIWQILKNSNFRDKEYWKFSFFEYLDDSLLKKEYIQEIELVISNFKGSRYISFARFGRWLEFEPNIFQNILKIIVERNEKEKTNLGISEDTFVKYYSQLGNDISLIKQTYLQQDKRQDLFDFDGKGMVNILRQDPNFLLEWFKNLAPSNLFRSILEEKELGFIWQIENIESILLEIFDLLIEKELFIGLSEHSCNAFFKNLTGDGEKKAKIFLIQYCKNNFNNSSKMNALIDITRYTMVDLFEEILLLFLSMTQDEKTFSKITWRRNKGVHVNVPIISDVQAAEWRNILAIVNKSGIGIKLIPIKKYIQRKIESCKREGDWERKRQFLKKH